jgi:glycosyl transferase family 2
VIAYGCAIADEVEYATCALPGIRQAADPDSVVVEKRGQRCIFAAYNEILDEVRERPDLEAVALLHQDTEIADRRFAAKIREILADPLVAIVGAIGGKKVLGLAWWQGLGKGRVAAPRIEARGLRAEAGVRTGVVEAVDGLLLVLSGWAARELRFDENLGPGFHGYDVDICFQARARGRKVMVGDLEVIHHAARGFTNDFEGWVRADIAFRRKWERSSLMQRALAGI